MGHTFYCDLCDESFKIRGELIIHRKIKHHGEKPKKVCDKCQKTIKKRAFLAHLRTHDKSKIFKCLKCSSVFSQHMYLNRHIRYKCIGYKNDELLLQLEYSLLDK